MPYCDGSGHQGSRLLPIIYKGKSLYFRGANTTIERLSWLDNKLGLFGADNVALSGSSAGGLATLFWADYLQAKL